MQSARRQRGISLVELLVSLAIGVFLVGGALSVYIQGRGTYSVNESIARMQENANFALKYLERDIQLAGLWGTHRETGVIQGRAASNPIAAAVAGDCAPNWAIDLDAYLEGVNDVAPPWTCITEANHMDNTDVLTVRRASAVPVDTADLEAGRLYIRSSLTPRSQVFQGTAEPVGFPPDARNYPLVTRAYYVRPDSVGSADLPALRRIDLTRAGGGAVLQDSEIVPGVEDLQVQFGIEPQNAAVPGAVAYVDGDSPLLANSRIVSVRLWLLIRAEQPETGYVDDVGYQLGNIAREPANDAYRRMLVSRTFRIRNR